MGHNLYASRKIRSTTFFSKKLCKTNPLCDTIFFVRVGDTHLQASLKSFFYLSRFSGRIEALIVSFDSCQVKNKLGKKYVHNTPHNGTALH